MNSRIKHQFSRRDFLRISGVGVATAALAACAAPSAPQPAPSEGESAAAPVAEQVLLRIQGSEQYETPTGQLFGEIHPEVKVEFISVTGIDHEEVASKLLSMVAAGEAVDGGHACTEATQLYAGQGLSEKIDDYLLNDEAELKDYFSDVAPPLIEAMFYEGSLYQLARDFNAANMYYNTQLFEEAGYGHPDPEWTKDDFYEIAKAITKKNASGETEVFGYGWINRLWGSWMPWIFVNEGNLFVEERSPGGEWFWEKFYAGDPAAENRSGGFRWREPVANQPANVEALEFMVQLYDEGISPAVEMGGGATLQGFFTSNKLGMTVAGGFWAGGMHSAGMAPDAFDAQLWPAWKSQRHQFGVCAKFMFAQSQHKDWMWEYMKFEVSEEGMKASGYFNPYIITTPCRRSMCNAEAFAETGPAHWQVFYDTLDKHPTTAPIPCPPIANPMTTLFTSYTARAMNKEMTPQQALDAMQDELVQLVDRSQDIMYPDAESAG